MLNQVVMVGRLVSDPTVQELESGKKVSNITLAVPRSYKNEEGEYDTDFVDCALLNTIADRTTEFFRKGDLVGIKGRIQTDTYEVEGETKKRTSVIAEKVTFLSSNSKERNEEKEQETDEDLDM